MSDESKVKLVRFGWWDTFNEVLYTVEADAIKATEGGNDVLELYRLVKVL